MDKTSLERMRALEHQLTQCQCDLRQSHEREHRCRHIFDSMTEGFVLAEISRHAQPYDLRLLEVNEAFGRLIGVPPALANGRAALEVVSDLEPRLIDTLAKVALTGIPVRLEWQAEGLAKWFEVRAYKAAPMQIAALFLDISERKRAEQAYTEQSKLAEAVFSQSISPLAVFDRNYNFLRVNAAYARAAHREISELIGRNHFEVYPSGAKYIFDEVMRTKRSFTAFARPFVFPDQPARGVTYWDWTLVPVLDQKGEVEYLVFSLVEVTERMITEQALSEGEARCRRQAAELELIYRTAPVGLCVVDTQLRFVHVNERLAEINGLPVEAHLGKTVREVVPDIAQRVEPLVRHVLETGEPVFDFETRAETPAQPGVQRTWLSQLWPLRAEDGSVAGINVVAEEITERKRLEEARRSEQEFRTLAENSTDVVARFDRALRRVYVNPAIETILGRPRADVVGKTHREMGLPEPLAEALDQPVKEVFDTGQPRTTEATVSTPQGERYFDSRLVPEFGIDHKVDTVLAITRDITDRKRAQQVLEDLALRDPLTGVANRRYLEQFTEQEWRREARHRHPVALIMVDIDFFKAYNDRYGHQQGDECLRQVAGTLRQLLHRPADTLVRYGGEEFAVLLPETDLAAARELAERMRQAVEAQKLSHVTSPLDRVTISLGVAAIMAQKGEFRDLMTGADTALYRAKERGRNRVETTQ